MDTTAQHPDWIVVEDPQRQYNEGSLVRAPVARQLGQRGATVLPVDPQLFKRSGIGGYMRRAWGAGYPLDFPVPRIACPVAIFASHKHTNLHWAARLVAGETIRRMCEEGRSFEGVVQLTSDSGQVGGHHAGVRQLDPPRSSRDLGQPDDAGGWTIEGRLTATLAMDGVHGFGLYGFMPGVRVAWLALSLTVE